MVSTPHFIWAICLCMATTAAGHGMMVSPRPRAGTRNAGNNKGRGRGPCGSGTQLQTPGAPTKTYQPGQSVDVTWKIDAAHGGNCRISLSTSGGGRPTGLQDLTGLFACARRGGEQTKTVTIPQDASCQTCVLQWYWDGDSDYFNCMDVAIGPPPTPPPPPAPTPAPTPMPPKKTDEPWSLWMATTPPKCLNVHDNKASIEEQKAKGQLSTDAELVIPGVLTGEIDAEHDGGPCSAFHAHQFGGERSIFRLCECTTEKDCMCSNQALTYIKSEVGGGVDTSGAWEVRIEDGAHLNKNQLFDQKPDGSNCVVSDDTKCFTVHPWKAPKPSRRRTAPKPTKPPCKDKDTRRRRRRRSEKKSRRRSSKKK